MEVKVPNQTRGQISRPEHVTQPALSPSVCVPHAWPMGTLARASRRGLCRKGHNIFCAVTLGLRVPAASEWDSPRTAYVACVSVRGSGACANRVGSVASPRAALPATPAA